MIPFKKFINESLRGIIPSPIHFKYVNKTLNEKESNPSIHSWTKHNDNSHLGNSSGDISKKLDGSNNFTSKHETHVKKGYTSHDGEAINKNLIKGGIYGPHKNAVTHIDDAIDKNKIKHHVHVYSGLSFDPKKHIKDGKFHSPSYISTTHDKPTALKFAKTDLVKKPMHIAHIKLKPGDSASHISKISFEPHEHETLIKRGQTLIHHGSILHKDESGNKMHIHHFTME